MYYVLSTAYFFAVFTSIDFETEKLSRPCTALYGKAGLCTLLYVLYAVFHVLGGLFGSWRRLFLFFAVKYFTKRISAERILRMKLKTAVQRVRRVRQF